MWTEDEFGDDNMSCQLQDHHWPSESAANRDWAPAAVAGEGKSQAPKRLPEVVEPGGFQCTGDWPYINHLFTVWDNTT